MRRFHAPSSSRKRPRPNSSKLRFEPLEDRRLLTLHPLTSVPALDSLPGAAASLFLDFDGNFAQPFKIYTPGTTPAYDVDNDPTTFSDEELANITEIWQFVAEDYAPFNLNVTTVEPPSFAAGVALRVSIGGDGLWFRNPPPNGVAQAHGYFDSELFENVAWVFSVRFPEDAQFVGGVASHEAGHAFGLFHQAGGIMLSAGGNWWNDPSVQDDMAVIADTTTNGFGYRADDHGDTPATASPLVPSGGQLVGSGIITQTTDVDYFSFDTDDARVTINMTTPGGVSPISTPSWNCETRRVS